MRVSNEMVWSGVTKMGQRRSWRVGADCIVEENNLNKLIELCWRNWQTPNCKRGGDVISRVSSNLTHSSNLLLIAE